MPVLRVPSPLRDLAGGAETIPPQFLVVSLNLIELEDQVDDLSGFCAKKRYETGGAEMFFSLVFLFGSEMPRAAPQHPLGVGAIHPWPSSLVGSEWFASISKALRTAAWFAPPSPGCCLWAAR